MLNNILLACLVAGILALLFGIVLTVADKVFAVYKDPKVEEVREALPGANCGGCGKAGCDAMAEAMVKGEASANACPVGGAPVAEKISAILGVENLSFDKTVSFVNCGACKDDCVYKFDYKGAKDCVEAQAVLGGDKACAYGCLGFGSCVKVCKFDAIHINEKGVAEIDKEKCTSCYACAKVCPRNVISALLYDQVVHVACNNHLKGKKVKDLCKSGCISCGICVKNCPTDAITLDPNANLPVVDASKCEHCLVCVEKCPQKCITADIVKEI